MQKRLLERLGKKFNRLTVITILGTVKGKRKCITKCDCGNIQEQYLFQITGGQVKSCGCLMKETSSIMWRKTGMAAEKHRLYKIREGIQARCNNKKNHSRNKYGGRGIKNLRKTFEEFKDDMYEGYLDHVEKYGEKQTTIDRIDNNGNYCKENCRRATYKEQNNNTRKNILLGYKGTIDTLPNICNKFGFKKDSIYGKFKRGTLENYGFILAKHND